MAASMPFTRAPVSDTHLGARTCGILLHQLGEDAVETTLLEPAGMERPFIHEIRDQAYPAV